MAGKRGYVHECPKERCEWLGEKNAAVHHYAKRHCSIKDAPFACDLCRFTTGSDRELTKHCESSKHIKAMKGNGDDERCIHKRKNEDEILQKFTIWSPERSKAHWEVKLKEKTASETRPEKKKTPAGAPQPNDLIRVTPTSLENLDKEELIKRLMAACAGEQVDNNEEVIKVGNIDEVTEAVDSSEVTEAVDNSEAAEKRDNGEAEESSTKEQKEKNTEEIKLEQAIKSITAIPKTLSPNKDAVTIEKPSKSSSTSDSRKVERRSRSPSRSGKKRKDLSKTRSLSSTSSSCSSSSSSTVGKKRQRESSDERDYVDWKRRDASERKEFDIVEVGLERPEETQSDSLPILREIRDVLSESFQDRTSMMATGMTGISREMIGTNKKLANLGQRMNQMMAHQQEKERKDGSRDNNVSDLKGELRSIKQTLCVHQNTSVGLTKAVNELTTSVKVMRSTLENVATSLETFGVGMAAMFKAGGQQQTGRQSVLPPSVDRGRLTQEFNEEWAKGGSTDRWRRDRGDSRARKPDFRVPQPPHGRFGNSKNGYRRSVDRSISTVRRHDRESKK